MIMLNKEAQDTIKNINDDLLKFYNQPFMSLIPQQRKVEFKKIMSKLIQLEGAEENE